MKAIIQQAYGEPHEVLQLGELDVPVPKEDEVLVRVRAASVHADVWHMVRGEPYVLRLMGAGLRRPKNPVPGTDVAGVVESVGHGVTRFQSGDEVFAETIRGHQWTNGGAYAQFVAVHEDQVALKPAKVSFEAAAALPTSGLIAFHGVKTEGRVRSGQRVLVNGAGGGVGSIAVQLAKAYGANVTGVDWAHKLEMVRSLGANEVIDAAKVDFTEAHKRYDVIVDVPGNHRFSRCRRALTPHGVYVLIGHDHYGALGRRVVGLVPYAVGLVLRSRWTDHLPKSGFSAVPKKEALETLRGFLEAGSLTPHVDRVYALNEVAQAIVDLAGGRVQGKSVIRVT